MKMGSRTGVLLAVVTAVVALAVLPAPAEDQVELTIELPKPFFGGTPSDYIGPNLEPRSFKEPGPISVPKGTANVALNKAVSASKPPNFGKLEQIVDGDKSYEEKSLVEVGPGLQWVQIDLEKPHTMYALMVWHFHAEDRVYFDVIVQASMDPEFEHDVVTIYNNDHDNSAGLGAGKHKEYYESHLGRLMQTPEGVKGRYLRLYSRGNDNNEMNHYVEVEVYGVADD
jgi:hypothetical protein